MKQPMYGIFTQGKDGLNWHGNETSLEHATALLADYDHREDVNFAMVLEVAAFRDIDGMRMDDTDDTADVE